MDPDSSVERGLFEAALSQPAADRDAFLDAHCADVQLRGRVRALLDAHDRAGDGFLSHSAGELAAASIGRAGRRLGAYRIVQPEFVEAIIEGRAIVDFSRQPGSIREKAALAHRVPRMLREPALWLRNPRHVLSWTTLPFVLAHMAAAHKEARFLFPMAIMATATKLVRFDTQIRRKASRKK